MTLFEITHETFARFQSNRNSAREGLDLSQFVNKKHAARVENGIGHVFIYGPLLSDAAPIDRELGCTDYRDIIADAETVMAQGAKSILLHINSGGGMVNGCIEAALFIQNLPLPVVAYVEGMACSAAYKIASSATYIVATRSSDVGNIGAIMVFLDTSVINENIGIAFNCFTNEGAVLKSTGHLDSLTDEQKSFLQASINDTGAAFQNHVISNRPAIDREVFNAGWFSGDRALALGLIDAIGDERAATAACESLMSLF